MVSIPSYHLPLVLSHSNTGTVRIWHSSTYRLETTLNYGLERMWFICCLRGSNDVALGYDEGSVVVKVRFGIYLYRENVNTGT